MGIEPTPRQEEDARISCMLLELELNRGSENETEKDIEIVRNHLLEINKLIAKNKTNAN